MLFLMGETKKTLFIVVGIKMTANDFRELGEGVEKSTRRNKGKRLMYVLYFRRNYGDNYALFIMQCI